MTYVYVVVIGVEYEGEDIEAIYSTPEKAQAHPPPTGYYTYKKIYRLALDHPEESIITCDNS